jgi:hypothetical protein
LLEEVVELVLDVAGGVTPVAAAKRSHMATGMRFMMLPIFAT